MGSFASSQITSWIIGTVAKYLPVPFLTPTAPGVDEGSSTTHRL